MIYRGSASSALCSAATCLLLILISLSPPAHAFPTTWTVNNPGDPAGGNASNCASFNANTCTLRDAVAAALGGDTIAFTLNPGQNTITLANGALTLSNASGTITIDGTNLVDIGGQQVSFQVVVDGKHSSGVFINNGEIVLQHLTIQNGLASYGGGIANYGTLTLSNVTLSGNSTSVLGAGVGLGGGIYNQGTLTLTDSTLSGNSALNGLGSGGGIYEDVGSTVTLTNCTLSGNSASSSGGGIYNASGTATLANCSLSGNSASTSNGIASNFGHVNLTNTIIADGCAFGSGGFIDHGGNLDSGASCGFGGSSKSYSSLFLGPLQNNGGATRTMMPGPGSDAIDFANCATSPTTDQRGVSRPQAIICDSGAVEVRPYALNLGVTGSGSVDSATPAIPAVSNGIVGCTASTGTCVANFAESATVALTATPAAGFRTVWWSAPCAANASNVNQATVTLNANSSCTVRFWSNDRIFADGFEGVPPL